MKTEIMEITPQIAESWLKKSRGTNYRKLDKKRVKIYETAMSRGEWELNGQSIQLRGDGTVLDGQHRLQAIINAGVTIEMLVVFDVKSDGLHIDRGKPRNVAQHLQYMKVKNATQSAVVARLLLQHETGQWDQHYNCAFTDDMIIKSYQDNEDSITDANLIAHKVKWIPRSLCAALSILGSGEYLPSQNDTVVWFWSAFVSGANISNTDPVHHLRERMIAHSTSQNRRLPPFMVRMLATLAWNKTCEGVQVKQLKIAMTGPAKTTLPKKVLVGEGENAS